MVIRKSSSQSLDLEQSLDSSFVFVTHEHLNDLLYHS